MTFTVTGSLNNKAPTAIAVTGSKTPKTDVFVAPINFVEIAKVIREIMVGNNANPDKFIQFLASFSPLNKEFSSPDL